MTETINLVGRCKFLSKDLPSSGSMIVEIDAAGSGKDEHETSPRGTTIPAKSSWDT